MVIAGHFVESSRIESVVPQEFIQGAMELACARFGIDVDLSAACPAHVSRVASGLDLELLYGVGRQTNVLRVEGGISIGDTIN